ncbi:FMN-binding glutamate synthase family protein [Rhodobacteraceae bacterium NNCM2]|nr:FMN-binding glutamate synthase family protein [Coraliihabitans acroporae]
MDFAIFVETGLRLMSAVFVSVVGFGVLAIIVMFTIDRIQTSDAVRRNYPVLGRFRRLFTELGEFFRQYFFAMDREELPFNRAQRDWIGRAADGTGNTVAFGSTRDLTKPGTAIYVNTIFPVLEKDIAETETKVIGPFARQPYDAPSFFNISAMSFGALSKPAVKALSRGAAEAGIWLNTGEGGLSDWHLEGGCDIVFQIGTAKYGVRNAEGHLDDDKLREIAAHEQVRMFELKLSQGAKPGKGGILPAEKVTETIARIRGIPVGQASISPNRHVDVDNLDDLLDMIERIREVTGKPTGFKSVFGSFEWLDELCQKIIERGVEHAPDFITVDSGDGGTGAAPMPLMDNVGLTVRESLPIVSDTLHKYGLRERVRLIASGKMVNPTAVALALATGADFVASARGFMFSLGCIQALKCNRNTCPTGITTHDERLQRGLVPREKYRKVAAYARSVIHEVEVIAHSCGVTEPRGLRRHHVRIVQQNGLTVPLDKLYPRPETIV